MRSIVTLLLLACLTATAPVCLFAEVIHLKNGRTIYADQVRENGNHVEYDIGENTFAIPKTLVDHIEAGGVPPAVASQGPGKDMQDLPSFAPADDLKTNSTVSSKIIHDNQVDTDALSELEQAHDDRATGTGYFIAGKYEFERGDFAKARTFFENALRFQPDDPTFLNYYAALLARTGHASQGLPFAEHAVRIAPESPETLTVLGFVQYAADRNDQAIQTWKHSLAIRPDPMVQKYLDKAQRDATAEANFSEKESSHFTLRFEGKQTSESLRGQMLATLESDYDELVRELGVAPKENIPVVLYTDQAFFDVTQAPSWSGAVNDGKLRIPVNGLNSITPDLARVLKHELAHSFIAQISAGRCPQWLNEGIAQAVEPKQIVNGRLLATLFKTQHEIPINALEGNFMQLTPVQAAVAYDESLAAVLYISNGNGMGELVRVLQMLSQGSSTEAALRSVIHSDYGQLEADLGKYLGDTYGN